MTEGAPSVLVTGANSGIGAAAVSELLERGTHVVATVRSDSAAAVVDALRGSGTLDIEHLDVTDATRHRWVELTDAISTFYPEPEQVGRVIADAAIGPDPERVYRVGFGSRLGVLSNLVPRVIEDRIASVLFRLGG